LLLFDLVLIFPIVIIFLGKKDQAHWVKICLELYFQIVIMMNMSRLIWIHPVRE